MTIKFCKERAGSEGVRHFIERDVVAFAAANPQTVVYLKPRRNREVIHKRKNVLKIVLRIEIPYTSKMGINTSQNQN